MVEDNKMTFLQVQKVLKNETDTICNSKIKISKQKYVINYLLNYYRRTRSVGEDDVDEIKVAISDFLNGQLVIKTVLEELGRERRD